MFVEHKEVGEVTEAPARTLKLSEAIRIGCGMDAPNDGRSFFHGGGPCAVGAAHDAIFGKKARDDGIPYKRVAEYLGISNDKWNDLGISCRFPRQSREQIA